ncbi:MAG: hypothetical protein K6U14_01415 [Firmicutes bacterium]|nr:hypothetical protein [Alicyclobacillaceae bacterium]MCL6496278.1 hypothetical protein [Bacillota bacterium]
MAYAWWNPLVWGLFALLSAALGASLAHFHRRWGRLADGGREEEPLEGWARDGR